MTTNKSKERGTRAETAVARALQRLGFPHAERRTLKGNRDEGDITGCPGICWEVKGGNAARTASDLDIAGWMAETETERGNAKAEVGILVVQRKGINYPDADRWHAYIRVEQLSALLVPDAPHPLYDDTPTGFPICLSLANLTVLLRFAGYGEPLPSPKEGP